MIITIPAPDCRPFRHRDTDRPENPELASNFISHEFCEDTAMSKTLFTAMVSGTLLFFSVNAYSADAKSARKEEPRKETPKKEEPKPVVTPPTDIITRDLTPPTQNCAAAGGGVYKCN